MSVLGNFNDVWLVDFEFHQPQGHRPKPLCMVATEIRSHKLIRVWVETPIDAPLSFGPNDLLVAYMATAELKCFIELGWSLPSYVLDLYVEFKRYTNGRYSPSGHGLLGALAYFGLPGLETVQKETMRELAKRGAPYSDTEKSALIDYCQSDVEALVLLLQRMAEDLDIQRALIRGEYMKALAHIELRGVPVEARMLASLQQHWDCLKGAMIKEIDQAFGLYDGLTFKRQRFKEWLNRKGIQWPLTERGELRLDDDTFKEMARIYPAVTPLRELRASLSRLRLNELAVGPDKRNRCSLFPFSSTTSRNQPSTTQFIFGPSTWIRSLIRAEPGRALAYVDYEQQEFGIGASLSNDTAMKEAYETGDPYLTFAKQAGAIPPSATKQTHPVERERFKACALAVQYGMGETALAAKLRVSPYEARQLIPSHQETYKDYWRWSEAVQDHAMLFGVLQTTFGWQLRTSRDPNTRSLRNFPLQANGAEMLRLAIILASRASIEICAPVHDALLVEGEAPQIEEVVARTKTQMERASELVLSGFRLRTDAKVFRFPERFTDERGQQMWNTVLALLKRIDMSTCIDTSHPPALL